MKTWALIVLGIITATFIAHAVSLSFTQDDAFISYRYVRNLVDGHGLVFNPGERVEGYTNFLWVMVLSIFAKVGADVILTSKVLGVASGCVSLMVLYAIGLILFRDGPFKIRSRHVWVFAALPPAFLAANGAYAYWSISGLETTFFVLAVLLTVYLYFRDVRLSVATAAAATLIRPEGVLVFAILMLHNLAVRRAGLKSSARNAAVFVLLILPFLAFKLLYYGDLLPNPFYAKTGFSMEYLRSGMAYFRLFLTYYGLYGVLYLLPIVFYSHLDSRWRLIAVIVYAWTLYVIGIGGDVLKGYRFFTPLFPFIYLIAGFALAEVYTALRKTSSRLPAALCLAAVFGLATFLAPRSRIMNIRYYETNLIAKMEYYGRRIRETFGSDITLATTTIGAISYSSRARVIDMLGLTDREIAKNPERIPGISSTWKEKNFNTQYLLSRDPDIIMFSTGARPSAPAEKALYLSSQFRRNYYPYYFRAAKWCVVYRRKGEFKEKNEVFGDPRFVGLYSEAVRLGRGEHDFDGAIEKLEEVVRIGPPDFAQAYELLGSCYLMKGETQMGRVYLQKAVQLDEYASDAQRLLCGIYVNEGNDAAAAQALSKLQEHNPELLQGE